MNETVTIKVYEVVGSNVCVAVDDGQRVYEQVSTAIRSGRSVEVSFKNVTSLTSAFLNPAIGQLYGEFTEEEIRDHLSVTDMQKGDLTLVKRVVDTAKRYFKDPVRINNARQEILGAN